MTGVQTCALPISDQLSTVNVKSYPGDVDDLSAQKVFNQNINNTDIYGTYG